MDFPQQLEGKKQRLYFYKANSNLVEKVGGLEAAGGFKQTIATVILVGFCNGVRISYFEKHGYTIPNNCGFVIASMLVAAGVVQVGIDFCENCNCNISKFSLLIYGNVIYVFLLFKIMLYCNNWHELDIIFKTLNKNFVLLNPQI